MGKRLEEETFRVERTPDRNGRPGLCFVCGGAVVEDVKEISPDRSLKQRVCRTCRAEYGTAGSPVRHH